VIEVLAVGLLATVQDGGRPGLAHLGVPPSGAADRPAHALANRLVGNRPDAPAIEATLGGVALRLLDGPTRFVAVAGAPAPLRIGGRPAPILAPAALRTGATLELGVPSRGLRTYLAIGGGLAVEPVLGSTSTDALSGLGPAPLAAGTRLDLGWAPQTPAPLDAAPPPFVSGALSVIPGPRDDHLTGDGWATLLGSAWAVRADSDRVGVRLEGPRLEVTPDPIDPEGLVTGAVQVPPSGQPVVFLPDHPVTGGYPVVGVLTAASVAALAQARPGDLLRFSTTSRRRLPWVR
jgi:biotin-dependent carboxylase-like uncharacterized protein